MKMSNSNKLQDIANLAKIRELLVLIINNGNVRYIDKESIKAARSKQIELERKFISEVNALDLSNLASTVTSQPNVVEVQTYIQQPVKAVIENGVVSVVSAEPIDATNVIDRAEEQVPLNKPNEDKSSDKQPAQKPKKAGLVKRITPKDS